jgi:hypothetical protein
MTAAYFEDHPTDPEKVILRKPKHDFGGQEPVAWISAAELMVMRGNALGGAKDWRVNVGLVKQDGDVGLYTTPPQCTWEPVETAPKDGTDVLLMYMHIDTQVVHNGFWIGASDTDDESEIGWWSYDYSEVTRIKLDDWMTPTHWLPLPKLKEKNT